LPLNISEKLRIQTSANTRRVLFGAINVRTARRTIYIGRNAGAHEVRAFLLALRKAYRRAGTIWLLADRASGHTAQATLALAEALQIEFVWLPRQWPELNAMDHPCLSGCHPQLQHVGCCQSPE
jgi:DDE superfamily endonuclease